MCTTIFFDMKVFNPNAQTKRQHSLSTHYTFHEKVKKRMYEQQICDVEHGSFTPLVFSTTGGMGKAANIFYKRLASQLASKRKQPYHIVMDWMRYHLSFLLLRLAILCIRGAHSKPGYAARGPESIQLAVSKDNVQILQ